MQTSGIGPNLRWVRECYNQIAISTPLMDPYHVHTHRELDAFVWKHTEQLRRHRTGRLLNVGSGGKTLGIVHPYHLQIDVAEKSLIGAPLALAADVQDLPFADNSFDFVLCVGCVVNYCDIVRATSELARVLKPGGKLILDWERAHCWEFLGTPTFSNDVHPVKTFYSGTTQYLWVYSDAYVRSALSASGMQVLDTHYFHLLSQAVLRFFDSPGLASKLCFLDPVLRCSSGLRSMAGHAIYLCSRT